ncbi:MAG: hypothetical protein WKG07_23360 [Hymenobacter sp.]
MAAAAALPTGTKPFIPPEYSKNVLTRSGWALAAAVSGLGTLWGSWGGRLLLFRRCFGNATAQQHPTQAEARQ